MSTDIDPLSTLEGFIHDEVIDEIVGLVKPGKEAVVYLARKCSDPPRLFAAKIYRDIIHRRFRDDSTYRAGRFIKDARTRRKRRQNVLTPIRPPLSLTTSAESSESR